MTLITVAANPAFIVQVADRRLSTAAGPLPVEQTKAIHFHLPASDFLVGYTGLALVGNKGMHQILMEVLQRSAELGNYEIGPTAEAITAELTKVFRSKEVRAYRPEDRRLTVMMTGFNRIESTRYTLIQGLWTNYQDWNVGDYVEANDTFMFTHFAVRPGETWPTIVQRIGAFEESQLPRIESAIRPLLSQGKPPRAVRDRLVLDLPELSRQHRTVGVNANAAILYPNGQIEWSYSTGKPEWHYSIGNSVIAVPGQDLMVSDFVVEVVDSKSIPDRGGTAMTVPRVAKNRPCPCGSGRRYRQCHGLTS